MKIAILGRLSIDKVFAVTNLARHLDAYPFEGTKTLYVIGNGPEENRIVPEDYPSVNIVFTGPMFDEKLDAFLVKNVDVMFAMGTSALASGRLAIPTVVVCNEVHDYDDDVFVYLQEAKGFCLGWQVEQAPSFDIPIRTCAEILDDIRDAKKQKQLGDSVHQYVSKFHNAKFAADEFLKAAAKTTLTYRRAKEVFLGWQIEKKTYRLGFKGKLRAVRFYQRHVGIAVQGQANSAHEVQGPRVQAVALADWRDCNCRFSADLVADRGKHVPKSQEKQPGHTGAEPATF